MERSAVYRRALAPIMLFVGFAGVLTAAVGLIFRFNSPKAFSGLWLAAAVVAIIGTLLIARKQAFKDRESFWSPPTRRVAQAMLLPLAAGCLAGVVGLFRLGSTEFSFVIMIAWMVLYGCALYSAGFFMQRGLRLFGCGFVLIGFGLLFTEILGCDLISFVGLHILMGFFFGVFHLAYGAYLYLTEKGKNAA
jgi:hypothetical protein